MYEYGTLQSSVSSYEMNTMAMKLNKLNPTEIEKTKADVAAIDTRVTSLENKSGGTDSVIEELRAGINENKTNITLLDEKTAGITNADGTTNIQKLSVDTVDGVLKDKDGFTYLKVIRGKPKTLPMGYSDVEVLIYPDNSCVINGVLTEVNNKDVEAFNVSENIKWSILCDISSIQSIIFNDITIGEIKFMAFLKTESTPPLINISYRNITNEKQNIIGVKLHFTIKGIKSNRDDILFI